MKRDLLAVFALSLVLTSALLISHCNKESNGKTGDGGAEDADKSGVEDTDEGENGGGNEDAPPDLSKKSIKALLESYPDLVEDYQDELKEQNEKLKEQLFEGEIPVALDTNVKLCDMLYIKESLLPYSIHNYEKGQNAIAKYWLDLSDMSSRLLWKKAGLISYGTCLNEICAFQYFDPNIDQFEQDLKTAVFKFTDGYKEIIDIYGVNLSITDFAFTTTGRKGFLGSAKNLKNNLAGYWFVPLDTLEPELIRQDFYSAELCWPSYEYKGFVYMACADGLLYGQSYTDEFKVKGKDCNPYKDDYCYKITNPLVAVTNNPNAHSAGWLSGYGNNLIYHDDRNVYVHEDGSIVGYDVRRIEITYPDGDPLNPKYTEYPINTSEGDQVMPSIYGDYVVYIDMAPFNDEFLSGYDMWGKMRIHRISTGEDREFNPQVEHAAQPLIYNDIICWMDGRFIKNWEKTSEFYLKPTRLYGAFICKKFEKF